MFVFQEQLCLAQILVMCLWHHCDSDDHFQHSIYTLSEEGVGGVHTSHSVPSTTVARFRLRADIPVLVTTEGNTGWCHLLYTRLGGAAAYAVLIGLLEDCTAFSVNTDVMLN